MFINAPYQENEVFYSVYFFRHAKKCIRSAINNAIWNDTNNAGP